MIDRRPAAIAQCATVGDVVAALEVARASDAPLAIRAGGHSVAGTSMCDDGLVIDVRGLSEISVDPDARTARTGAGATWAAVRRGDAGARARDDRRARVDDRRRRAHARRRLRLARALLRPRLRQPHRRRARDGGRARSSMRAPTRTRSSSGRSAAAAATSASSPPSSSGCTRSARPSSAASPRTTRSTAAPSARRSATSTPDGGAGRGRPRVRLHRRAARGVHPARSGTGSGRRHRAACGTARSRRASGRCSRCARSPSRSSTSTARFRTRRSSR